MSRAIRLATPADAAGVAAIYDPVVERTAISFETEPPGPRVMGERIVGVLAFAPWLVLLDEDGVAGFAYASRHHVRAAYQWSVDVTVYVRDGSRRAGVGRALYGSLFALLRLQGLRAAHAGITLPNAGSVGLHEALGFVPVGVYRRVGWKLGAWRDVGWWQLELAPREAAPAPPVPLPALVGTPAFDQALSAGLAQS